MTFGFRVLIIMVSFLVVPSFGLSYVLRKVRCTKLYLQKKVIGTLEKIFTVQRFVLCQINRFVFFYPHVQFRIVFDAAKIYSLVGPVRLNLALKRLRQLFRNFHFHTFEWLRDMS